MTPTRQGSFRLFRFAGIDVYLHWSWFLVGVWAIQSRSDVYPSLAWNVVEYLTLFVIVLMHEFGHALACRQVGGVANQIVLWPLGGVAYVNPPQRPGATLWAIAAGPLVNVALVPLLILAGVAGRATGFFESVPQALRLLQAVWYINTGLLVFNLLPIYPLDGGQILRSLLWFPLGRGRSLMVVSIVGFVGVALLFGISLLARSVWMGVLSGFIMLSCWRGLVQARALARIAAAPRRDGFACPGCQRPPPVGELWMCGQCRTKFDTFATLGVCPRCNSRFLVTSCPECHAQSPIEQWGVFGRIPAC